MFKVASYKIKQQMSADAAVQLQFLHWLLDVKVEV